MYRNVHDWNGFTIKVFLNGEKSTLCVAADDKKGIAWILESDDGIHIKVFCNPRTGAKKIRTKKVFGNIEFKYSGPDCGFKKWNKWRPKWFVLIISFVNKIKPRLGANFTKVCWIFGFHD